MELSCTTAFYFPAELLLLGFGTVLFFLFQISCFNMFSLNKTFDIFKNNEDCQLPLHLILENSKGLEKPLECCNALIHKE